MVDSRSGHYVYYSCRPCNTNRMRRYRKTSNGKAVIKKIVSRYEHGHKDRRSAWDKASLIPRKPCVECGKEESVRHHPDISRPLEVVMLCQLHHKAYHREESMLK